MLKPTHRTRDRVLASQGRRSLTEVFDRFRRTGDIMLKDLGLFLSLCLLASWCGASCGGGERQTPRSRSRQEIGVMFLMTR